MNQDNNDKLITKKDYEILGIKEESTVHEIKLAHQKLSLQYHPAIIRKEKGREPNELELKRFQEIEKVYKKFDLEPEMYVCCGIKEGVKFCLNTTFYPALWIKEEKGKKSYFCSQECYNSKWKSDALVEKWEKEDREDLEKSLTKAKLEWSERLEKSRKKAGLKIADLEPQNRNFFAEIHDIDINLKDANFWDNKIKVRDKLIDEIYAIYNRVEEDIENKAKNKREKESKEYCDNCSKEIKKYKDENGHIVSGIGGVDQDGNQHKFCSRECSKKFGGWKKVVKKNVFAELLNWMESEGITNIYLDPSSGKLVVEYGKNNSKTIENNNLTPEQKEIKSFFQQGSKKQFSRSELIDKINNEEDKGKQKNNNGWVAPIIIGMGVLTLVLIGIIIYKSKKKNY